MFEDEMEEGAARLAEFFTIPFAVGPGMNEDSVSVRTAMGAANRSAGPSVAAGSLLVNSTSPYSCGDVDRNAYPDKPRQFASGTALVRFAWPDPLFGPDQIAKHSAVGRLQPEHPEPNG